MTKPVKKEIQVLILKEIDSYVAQCLEYDISAQAKTLRELQVAFDRAFLGEILIALEHGEEPLVNIDPAPDSFWRLFNEAIRLRDRMTIQPSGRIPLEIPIGFPEEQIAELAII